MGEGPAQEILQIPQRLCLSHPGTIFSLDRRLTTMASPSTEGSSVDILWREGEDMAHITLNEGLAWMKTLKKRHEELIGLRNENAHRERRFLGSSADREIVKEPVYDVKVLDKAVTAMAREIRLLEQALKATHAKTMGQRFGLWPGCALAC